MTSFKIKILWPGRDHKHPYPNYLTKAGWKYYCGSRIYLSLIPPISFQRSLRYCLSKYDGKFRPFTHLSTHNKTALQLKGIFPKPSGDVNSCTNCLFLGTSNIGYLLAYFLISFNCAKFQQDWTTVH